MITSKKAAWNAAAEIKSLLKDNYSVKVDGDAYVFITAKRGVIHGVELNRIADYCKAHDHSYFVGVFDNELSATVY